MAWEAGSEPSEVRESPRVAAVLSCYERHNRGDQRGWLELFDEDMDFRTEGTRFVEETSLHGKDAVVKWFIGYFEAFREYEFKIEDVFEIGDWVVALAPVRGVGRSSGIEVGHFGVGCYRFDGEKIVEFRTFGDVEAALSAVRA
jgi:ketosteroid isomerase-like protein